MEDNEDTRSIRLIACDGNKGITVEGSAAKMIDLIDPDIIDTEEEEIPSFPLNKVRHKELERVVKFCKHCVEDPNVVSEIKNIPRPITTFRMRRIFSSWIADFVSKIPIGELFDLLAAAHFMQVDLLVELITIPVSMLIILEADGGETNKIFTEYNGKGKKKKKKREKSAKVTKNKERLKYLVKKQFT
jgi:hypothetical protein